MNELLPYIPTDRRHALARGEDLSDRAVGSALFVDISGFTPLAEALALDLGPQRGAEELTKHLNPVYDALIAESVRTDHPLISKDNRGLQLRDPRCCLSLND